MCKIRYPTGDFLTEGGISEYLFDTGSIVWYSRDIDISNKKLWVGVGVLFLDGGNLQLCGQVLKSLHATTGDVCV